MISVWSYCKDIRVPENNKNLQIHRNENDFWETCATVLAGINSTLAHVFIHCVVLFVEFGLVF